MYYRAEDQAAEVWMDSFHEEFLPQNRRWQGIASMERSRGGKLFVTFYSGGVTEQNGNFALIVQSPDDGQTWIDPVCVVQHADSQMRVYDPNLWLDPQGRLWFFWAQSHHYFDGRAGVWAMVCDNPDAPTLRFSAPRRIANGIMMCKPTVLRDGTWLLPCAVWVCSEPFEDHPEVAHERLSNVYASTDQGQTFVWRGGADVPNRCFDEHMVVEKRDGSLWMLVRRYDGLGEAHSYDGGYTWWQAGHAGISGPNSRFFVRRLASGNLLMVNHVDYRGRSNLTAQLSFDDGQTWQGGLVLDARANVSYPDGTQDQQGRIYIAYDFERYAAREVLMAVFTEADILAGRPTSPDCRLAIAVSKATGELPQ